jgi:hypothetical protein
MANYAVMRENLVTNIIVADTKETAEIVTGLTCIEYTQENPAGIGYTWDGIQFINPELMVIEGEVVPPAIEG